MHQATGDSNDGKEKSKVYSQTAIQHTVCQLKHNETKEITDKIAHEAMTDNTHYTCRHIRHTLKKKKEIKTLPTIHTSYKYQIIDIAG